VHSAFTVQRGGTWWATGGEGCAHASSRGLSAQHDVQELDPNLRECLQGPLEEQAQLGHVDASGELDDHVEGPLPPARGATGALQGRSGMREEGGDGKKGAQSKDVQQCVELDDLANSVLSSACNSKEL